MERYLTRFWLILLFLFWVGRTGSAPLEGQEPQDQKTVVEIPKIKVDVSLVTMDVTVIPAATRDLRPEDFSISDNDAVQQVTHFSRDQIPLSVALVVDRSSSIKDYLSQLQKSAVSALGSLKPEDQVALFTFDTVLLKLKDLTVDRDLVARIMDSITRGGVGGGTNLYGSLYYAARYFRMKALQSRRAIILISDNCQTVSGRIRKEDAYVEVLKSGVTLYSIQTPGENLAASCKDSVAWVKQLAEESGGEALNVDASTSLQEALEEQVSNLRLQYTMGFSPSDPGPEGSFHKLTVKLASEDRCPSCRLLTRRGYYTGTSVSLSAPKENRWIAEASPYRSLMLRRCIIRAMMTPFDLPDIPIAVRTSEKKDSDGKPQIKIDLHIDCSRIGFQTVGDRHRFSLYIAIFSPGPGTAEHSSWGEEWRVFEGMLKEEDYNRALRDGMSFSINIPRVAQEEILKIVAYDEGTDTVGSRSISAP